MKGSVWLASLLLMTTGLTPAFAQLASGRDTANRSTGLEQIVVTAQRRSQNLQSVPVSVTAFSQKTLTRSSITSTLAVQQIDPSLVVSTGSGINSPFVRGVGNASATALGNEASVPVYIDDVYFSRLNYAYLELANIESIEVLKGPQGTLFGRNSSGGAILINTRDPGPKWKAEGEVGYANYNTFTGKLYASGPINDWIGAGLSVSGQHQGSGWGHDIYNGDATYKQDFISIRGKIVAHPTASTKVTLSSFYADASGGQGSFNTTYKGTVAGIPSLYGAGPIYAPSNFYDSNGFANSTLSTHGFGVALKVEQELSLLDLESITSFRNGDEKYFGNGDVGTQYRYLAYNVYQYDREATQEFQAKSKKTSKVAWIIGVYYLDSRVGYYPAQIEGDALTSGGVSKENIYGQQTIKSYSGYGQTTIPIVDDRNHLTLGLRYSVDSVQGVGYSNVYLISPDIVVPGQVPYNRTVPFRKVTYKGAIDRKLTDTTLGYASYSRGYKSGTFNILPAEMAPTKSEVVDAYEVGLKTTVFDNRFRVNAALFRNDIANPQVETIIKSGDASFVGLTNAKGARSQGFEVNADARLAEGLTARFGVTYLDAYYTDFQNAPFYYPAGYPNYGNGAPASGNATGNRLAQIPKWRFTGGVNYDMDTSVGHFNLDGNLSYTGKLFWQPDNLVRQNSYYLLNASVTYDPPGDDRWYVMAYAKNMLGEEYYTGALELQGPAGVEASPGAPRTFGAAIGFRF